MYLFHFMILLPFIFAIFVPFFYKFFNRRIATGWFVLGVPLFLFVYLLQYIPQVVTGEWIYETVNWIPSLGINFTIAIDGLSLLFGLLITGMGALVVFYSIFYMSKTREALHNFYVYLLMFMGAMLGVVFSDNIMVLYVFWELTSISSFLLIAFWYERKASRKGALKALLITVTGGFAMLAGFILLIMMTDTLSIREMVAQADSLASHPYFIPTLILILIGAFSKSAQFPFGIWLPDAMEAPTPVSAYLHSATMVKAGIYLVARLTPVFGGGGVWFWLVAGTGLVTLLYGSWKAVKQTDLKALLAYSTISQLGLIMCLLGIGSLAFRYKEGPLFSAFATTLLAAVFHLFNHSTFKGSLFMIVGVIDHETGTRDIRRLGGLMNLMPITFTIALISSFSMAGLPPFSGFLSKEMFFESAYQVSLVKDLGLGQWGVVFPIIAWVASVFTFVYSLILVFKTFTGKYHPEKLAKKIHKAPVGMLISPALLACIVILVFFFPNGLSKYVLQPALFSILPQARNTGIGQISAWHGVNPALLMTIGVILFGIILYRTLKKWQVIYRHYPQRFTLNAIYANTLSGFERFSQRTTVRYMTGSLRHYLMYILLFFILVVGGALLFSGGLQFDFSTNSPVSPFDFVVVVAVILAALTVLMTNHRVTAVIALSAVGYLMVMLFVIFRAPDLALTQMVVETVSTVLFLLCFYHLPKLQKGKEKLKIKLTNLSIAVAVGLLTTLFTLAAFNHKLFESITAFFENAYELAGANNIVNAIIVDFRGFDTMIEIAVFTVAGLGVYSLIHVRLKEEDADEAE